VRGMAGGAFWAPAGPGAISAGPDPAGLGGHAAPACATDTQLSLRQTVLAARSPRRERVAAARVLDLDPPVRTLHRSWPAARGDKSPRFAGNTPHEVNDAVAVGERPGRPGVHAAGERVADDPVDRDDPGVDCHRLGDERHLRFRAVALGARLGALVGVAGGTRRGEPAG